MRKSFHGIAVIAVLVLMALVAACKKDEGVIQPPDQWAPPTNLKALSGNTNVKLQWTHSSSHTSSDFRTYRVTTSAGGTVIKTDSTTQNTITVSSLTNGSTYSFLVVAVKNDGSVSNGASLDWGPADQFVSTKIYEFASTNPSGLNLTNGQQASFSSSSPDNRGIIDLWIDGRAGATPLLKSPSDQNLSTGWHVTKLAQVPVGGTATLDTWVDVPDPSSFTTNPLTIAPSNVYFAITSTGHYARFVTSAVQGTVGNRYIDIQVAYNVGTGHWAKR